MHFGSSCLGWFSVFNSQSWLVAAMAPKATLLTIEQTKQLIKDHVADLTDNTFLSSDPDQVTLASVLI